MGHAMSVLLLFGSAALAPLDSVLQEAAGGIDAWKENLKSRAGVWITSNAEYAEEDGGIEEYGMDLTLQPGGVTATGCLWGERRGEVVGVFWHFFQGWDPTREAGLVHQSNAAGSIGVGYVEDRGPDEPVLIQDFWSPDGTTSRVGHFERMEGSDTRVGRSVAWSEGRWIPRRTYTWMRMDRESPC